MCFKYDNVKEDITFTLIIPTDSDKTYTIPTKLIQFRRIPTKFIQFRQNLYNSDRFRQNLYNSDKIPTSDGSLRGGLNRKDIVILYISINVYVLLEHDIT